jgi:hypothetical protein
MAALPTVDRNQVTAFSDSRKPSAALTVSMPAMSPAATRDAILMLLMKTCSSWKGTRADWAMS